MTNEEERVSGDDDIVRLEVEGKEIILIGTAHVSQESVDVVREMITRERPDVVCVELDEQRYKALRDKKWWESLNLFEVIRKGQAPFLIANLALSSYQKRLGLSTGVKPGSELAEAAAVAEGMDIEVLLVDRSIRTTLLRAWRKTGFFRKAGLATELLASIIGPGGEEEAVEMNEEALRRLRQGDTLSLMLEEMGERMPTIKTVLVDERDAFMAHGIRRAEGEKVIAVVGAAHLGGIERILTSEGPSKQSYIDDIGVIPSKSFASKAIPWLIPLIVVSLFVVGFFYGDTEKFKNAALAWILANGLLSALGAIIACGHPLTVLSAFVAAPITSLNPTIGAGFVTGLVQTFISPPNVRDMEHISDDLVSWKGWWTNRMARVLTVFVFSSLGSSIGTLVAFKWLKDLV
jgi:pheromone shutdown-related protein TraB